MKDHYRILGVKFDVSQNDIKKAYRKKVLLVHPDKRPNDKSAEVEFKELSEAYDILKDPQKRKVYDISMGISLIKSQQDHSVQVESTKDRDNERMRTGKPNVVIDPSGQVYVDIAKMGKDVNIDYFRGFFT